MTGIERLNKLVDGQNDSALKQVVDYLCTRKDLNDKFLNEEKDLDGMVSYIQNKARAQAHNGWNFLNDKVVYAWAVMYFLFPNEQLGLTSKYKKAENKETKNKEQKNHTNNVINFANVKEKRDNEDSKQLSLFGGVI